jgi:hypothetical protein
MLMLDTQSSNVAFAMPTWTAVMGFVISKPVLAIFVAKRDGHDLGYGSLVGKGESVCRRELRAFDALDPFDHEAKVWSLGWISESKSSNTGMCRHSCKADGCSCPREDFPDAKLFWKPRSKYFEHGICSA